MSHVVTASTRVAAVIGDPVGHSLSPSIHNAAFRAVGLDWVFVALPVTAGSAAAAVDGMRALGIAGMSVTMPHKGEVIAGLDEVEPDAVALGAVNCITRTGGRLIGSNTDGAGFLAGLRSDFDFDPDGASCVVLGAGGAAKAVVQALGRAGARSVVVVNRTPAAAVTAATLAGPAGSVGGPESVGGADLVVNATPLGMAGDASASLVCDPERLGAGQIVADLVYHPARTALMAAAQDRGARTSNGLSMLVHQAAVAFERWTGSTAPLQVMHDAARHALGPASEGLQAKS
jgi:shikimate dehydrogenase